MEPTFNEAEDAGLTEQQLQADKLRDDTNRAIQMGKAKRKKWIAIIGVAVLGAGAIGFGWQPLKSMVVGVKDRYAAATTAGPQITAAIPDIDLATATPEEIEAYATRKREALQAAEIQERERLQQLEAIAAAEQAKRAEEQAKQDAEPPLGNSSAKITWLTERVQDLAAKQKSDFNLLNDRIAAKRFNAPAATNASIDHEQLAAHIMPHLIQRVLDTPEGRDWLEDTVAWYVKRDIAKHHKHK